MKKLIEIKSFADLFNGFSVSTPMPGHIFLDLEGVLLKYGIEEKLFFSMISNKLNYVIKKKIAEHIENTEKQEKLLITRIKQYNKLIKKYKKLINDLTDNLLD
jgi:hypothetical protein